MTVQKGLTSGVFRHSAVRGISTNIAGFVMLLISIVLLTITIKSQLALNDISQQVAAGSITLEFVDHMDTPVWVAAASGEIIWANQAARTLLDKLPTSKSPDFSLSELRDLIAGDISISNQLVNGATYEVEKYTLTSPAGEIIASVSKASLVSY